jgi:hypothetical protein
MEDGTMHANEVERPPIPAQFYEPSLLKVFLFFVFAASFLIIPGVVTVTITKSK